MPANKAFDSSDFLKRTVKEMQSDEPPRENLMNHGSESLSNAELLAILLRTSSRKMNVVRMAQAPRDHSGGLRYLA